MPYVTEGDSGQRMDRWLKQHFPHLPFSVLQKWLRTGQIRVEGKRIRNDYRLCKGQSVRLPPFAGKEKNREKHAKINDRRSEWIRSHVIYRDDNIIALNKPSGLAVQGGRGIKQHVDLLAPALSFGASEPPRIVHRLDKEVSGVLILARHRKAAADIAQSLRQRQVKKIYLAILHGVPDLAKGKISTALTLLQNGEVKASEEGLWQAETRYSLIDHVGTALSLVSLEPKTGRKHQLRVHMQSIGTPVLGDMRYQISQQQSDPNLLIDCPEGKLFLHALHMMIPTPEKKLVISAPLPDFFKKSCIDCGFDLEKIPQASFE